MTSISRPTRSGASAAPTGRFAGVLQHYPLAQRALLLVPLLAVAGPFASLRPGAAGFPYFYRVLWFVALIVAVPLFWTRLRRRPFPLVYSLVTAWWLGWAPLTLLWTPAPAVGRTEVLAGSIAMVGSWVVLVLTLGRSDSLRLLRWGWLLAFAVTMVVVSWEWVTGSHLAEVTGVQEWVYSAYSVGGLDTNPNGLSNACVAMSAVMGAQLIREVNARAGARFAARPATTPGEDGPAAGDNGRSPSRRGASWRIVLLLLGLTLAGFTIYLTGSRAGILSLMVLLVLAAIWCRPTRRRLAVPVALVALAVALPIVQDTSLNQVRPPNVGRVAAGEPKSGHFQDSISGAQREADVAAADKLRKDLTIRGLAYLAERPLQGHGAGAALSLVAGDPNYEPGVPERERHVLNLHNTYLEIGVNYGLLGLLPILAVPLWALTRILRPRLLRRRWSDPIVYECLGILLALLITSIITSTSIGSPTFWLLAAYATALAWNHEDATRAAADQEPAQSGR